MRSLNLWNLAIFVFIPYSFNPASFECTTQSPPIKFGKLEIHVGEYF